MTKEEAIKELEFAKLTDNYMLHEVADMAIQALKQESNVLEESNNWTSVSERLPEDGTYLVTTEIINGKPVIVIEAFAKDLNKVDCFNFPEHKCGWYNYDSEYGYWEDTEVIAWMPLPLPCKQKL